MTSLRSPSALNFYSSYLRSFLRILKLIRLSWICSDVASPPPPKRLMRFAPSNSLQRGQARLVLYQIRKIKPGREGEAGGRAKVFRMNGFHFLFRRRTLKSKFRATAAVCYNSLVSFFTWIIRKNARPLAHFFLTPVPHSVSLS